MLNVLTEPLKRLIEENRTVKKLSDRMLIRENKSQETLRRYLEGVQSFTAYMKAESPDKAIGKLSRCKDITETLDGYVEYLIAKGLKPINLKAHWFGVKKWLNANRINGVEWTYITRPKVSSQILDRIPSKDELRRILGNKVSLRDRAFFLTALASGLRIGTLAVLQVKDYKPVEELGMITVEGGPSRKLPVGKSYYTFITPESRKALEDYLETRGPLNPQDPLFAKSTGEPLSRFVTNVTRQWRALLTRSNLKNKITGHTYTELHGHVLRKYFQTTCKLANCRADFVDFWLGHHPTKQDQYLNDSYFRPSIEAHLEEYRKAVPALEVFEMTLLESRSKELETLKAKLEELEQWKTVVQKTISEEEFQFLQWRRSKREYEEQTENIKTEKPKEENT